MRASSEPTSDDLGDGDGWECREHSIMQRFSVIPSAQPMEVIRVRCHRLCRVTCTSTCAAVVHDHLVCNSTNLVAGSVTLGVT